MNGRVEMVLDIQDGFIVQEFKSPQKRVAYEPQNALDVAMCLADLVSEMRGDDHLPGDHMGQALKDELIERHRTKLVQRFSLVLNSQRENRKKTNGQLSMELIDIVLAEIF